MTPRLRFGVFLAPFHKPGVNPTLALQNDLDLITWLDHLGYDEAWFGEHHSAGSEISASPEILIAAAAERTRHIRLGTGVISLSYHNPLWVAERIVMLDHLTRGRMMFGAGPGSLPTDGAMIGLTQAQTRLLMEDSLDIIMRLLRSEEPVTFRNERWDLRNARLHLRPYSNPLFDVAVAAVASPTGAKLAGRHGAGLLSVGATMAAGFDALALHWNILEAEAKAFGHVADRAKWRLVGPMHCAETKEQALRDVEYGIEQWFRYFQTVAAFPQMAMAGNTLQEMITFINESGIGVIGTPDECAAQIDRLMQQSNGGFGCYLLLGHNWANQQATHKSYEMIARHVMPRFQGQAHSTIEAARLASAARAELAAEHAQAVEAAGQRYMAEKAKRG
ncbi:MAG TPA: LLM class flavin-dependent oxidoreductase [Rhodopila sp.]|nr:LLM class flavin-dependent oxidoreductase [Rhodopila sp.]